VNQARAVASATGPVNTTWFIAQASLKGIVYYNTYKSPAGPETAAVMRIERSDAEVVVSGCTVVPFGEARTAACCGIIEQCAGRAERMNPVDSATYNLHPMERGPRTRSTEGRLFSFTALSPDGSMGLVNGLPPKRWPPFIARGVYSSLGLPSKW